MLLPTLTELSPLRNLIVFHLDATRTNRHWDMSMQGKLVYRLAPSCQRCESPKRGELSEQ
jgi:hypothetical protein